MNQLFKTLFATGAVFGAALCAEAGYDLPINGDFRGVPSRHHIVTGWRGSRGGTARLFPRRHGKHILELIAAPNAPKVAFSEMCPTGPGVLEVDADVSGRGTASLGFEAFDANRNLVMSGKQPWQLTDIRAKIKFNFQLNNPAIASVRITLTAEPGSVARFSDVDAEMNYAPPAPPVTVAPPAPPAGATPAPQALVHDGFYYIDNLPPVAMYQATVPSGDDIEFKLSENINAGQLWSPLAGYDARICRVEIKHKRKGVDYAKVELKGFMRGTTDVVFVNPAGKRFVVRFTSM